MNTREGDYVFIMGHGDDVLTLPRHVMFDGGCGVYDGGGSWPSYL